MYIAEVCGQQQDEDTPPFLRSNEWEATGNTHAHMHTGLMLEVLEVSHLIYFYGRNRLSNSSIANNIETSTS